MSAVEISAGGLAEDATRVVRHCGHASIVQGSYLMWRVAAVVTAMLIASSAGWADAYSDCTQSQDPNFKLQACTQVIAENSSDQNKVANAYLNRGNAYQVKRDFDAAIQE